MSAEADHARRASLAKVGFLLGRWVGHGQAHGGGEVRDFAQTETVTSHLDGELLTVEGISHNPNGADRRTHTGAPSLIARSPDRRDPVP